MFLYWVEYGIYLIETSCLLLKIFTEMLGLNIHIVHRNKILTGMILRIVQNHGH